MSLLWGLGSGLALPLAGGRFLVTVVGWLVSVRVRARSV